MCPREDPEAAEQQPVESLQGGPDRASWLQRLPGRWRRRAQVGLAFLLGAAAGVGVLLWVADPGHDSGRDSGRDPGRDLGQESGFRPDEHAVELIMFEAGPVARSRTGAGVGPLEVRGGVFLSGTVSSTVTHLGGGEHGISIRTPSLPVTLQPHARFVPVVMRLVVRDCQAAGRWPLADRPFDVGWRDEYGRRHVDRAGDFAPAIAVALTGYIDTACGPEG